MECGHKCPQKCFEPCGNCRVTVTKTLAVCGHQMKVECSKEPERKKCTQKCPLHLPCGHQCQEKCNRECTKSCTTLVDCLIKPACGHKLRIPCSVRDNKDPRSYDILKHCREACGVTLDCLHACAGSCGRCAQGRIHASCQEPCGALQICGHACESPCRETCRPCLKRCTYACVHSKCGRKCGEPCTPCTEPCERRLVTIRAAPGYMAALQ